jgi:hypothetical protein
VEYTKKTNTTNQTNIFENRMAPSPLDNILETELFRSSDFQSF